MCCDTRDHNHDIIWLYLSATKSTTHSFKQCLLTLLGLTQMLFQHINATVAFMVVMVTILVISYRKYPEPQVLYVTVEAS